MTTPTTGFPENISLGERRVLELAGPSPLCNKELAERLHISVSCVKYHLHSIYRKMGWNGQGSRAKLLHWYLSRGNGVK